MSSEKSHETAKSGEAGRDDDAQAAAAPSLGARAKAEKAARADRLAAEMRKNLLKRKRQRQAADRH